MQRAKCSCSRFYAVCPVCSCGRSPGYWRQHPGQWGCGSSESCVWTLLTNNARLHSHNLSQQSFFRKHAPSEKGPYGISSEVMDTYVKSCGKTVGVITDLCPVEYTGCQRSMMFLPLSWILCHYVHPGSRRQTPGQSAANKDWWDQPVSHAALLMPPLMDCLTWSSVLVLSSREAFPHRLWLHPGQRPQTPASTHEAE